MKLSIAWTVLVALGAATNAGAQAWIRQTPAKPLPKIHAFTDDGVTWNRVGHEPRDFYIDARGKCDEKWHTDGSSVLVVSSHGEDFTQANLHIDEDHRNYGPDHGNDWEHLRFSGPYRQPQNPANSPTQVCKDTASARAGNGPDRFERLTKLRAEGFEIALPRAYTSTFYLWCKPNQKVGFPPPPQRSEASVDVAATLVCHGNPKARDVLPPPPPPLPPGIASMHLFVNPSAEATWTGFCPKTLHVGGEMGYKLPDDGQAVNVSYRYVATRGAQVIRSDAFTTTFTASGTKNLHIFNLDFPFSTGSPSFKAPTNVDQPDVYKGSVVLEFIGNPAIHATLVPLTFDVTCLKKGKVVAPLGGTGNLASPMAPIDPVVPNGSGLPPIQHGTSQLPQLPNYVLRSVTPTPGFGGTIGLRVRVVNTGDASAPVTRIRVFRGGVAVAGADVNLAPLAPHGTHDIMIAPSGALSAPGILVVRIDPDNQVRESDENDNAATLRR